MCLCVSACLYVPVPERVCLSAGLLAYLLVALSAFLLVYCLRPTPRNGTGPWNDGRWTGCDRLRGTVTKVVVIAQMHTSVWIDRPNFRDWRPSVPPATHPRQVG